jgi:hypothetical protein
MAQRTVPELKPDGDFEQLFNGTLYSLMSWEQLTDFWSRVDTGVDWYIYAPGEALPIQPVRGEDVSRFVGQIDSLLRKDHKESYCGIVFADDVQRPSLIKIYDPNNLGSSCGSSGLHILPGWILSRLRPVELIPQGVVPANRRRWWRTLFAG